MNHTSLLEFLNSENLLFQRDVNLKTKTWLKRGGTAQIWIQPTHLPDLEKLVSWCQINSIQFEIVGNTSNCYFLNEYNPELVISTLKCNEFQIETDNITCNCGYNMSRLAKYCITHGISGYEGFIGLPGTVGGAAINNSGCYESLISELVQSVTILKNGKKTLLVNSQLNYQHRNSAIKSKEIDGVVTSVTFKIDRKEDPLVLERRAIDFQNHRKTFQENNYLNLGSTFCIIEFKTQLLIIRILNAVVQRLLNFIIRTPESRQKLRTKLFLVFRGAGSFRKYVSDYGVSCFTWKDSGADKAFKRYVDFIKRISTKTILEIDIKGENVSDYLR